MIFSDASSQDEDDVLLSPWEPGASKAKFPPASGARGKGAASGGKGAASGGKGAAAGGAAAAKGSAKKLSAAAKSSASKTVGGRPRVRPKMQVESDDDNSEDEDEADDGAAEVALALKKMADQVNAKRKRKEDDLKAQLEAEYNSLAAEVVAQFQAGLKKAAEEFDAQAGRVKKEISSARKECEKAEQAFKAKKVLFERELAALVKLVDAEAREVHECAAVKESTFKTVVGVHQEKTSQIVDLTKLKINKVSRMKPNLKPVAEALAIAVHDFERGVSEAARMS